MKSHSYLAALFIVATAFSQENPAAFSLSSLPPPLPAGVNSAAFPAANLGWAQRVKSNNDKAHKLAAGIQLVFDGDSITDFWQTSGKKIWAARYEKLGAFDFGISGDRTQFVLWRLDQGQVDGLKPKLVVLMIGTNNLNGNTDKEIAEGVTAIVKDYRKRCPDAVVLLQAIFPRGHAATDPLRARIKAINAIIAKLHDGKKVIYVDFGDKFLEPDGTLSAEIMPDFLHPSAKGYQIWADAIQPFIDTYFSAHP
jgi:lysophospholipase L1-like esterase